MRKVAVVAVLLIASRSSVVWAGEPSPVGGTPLFPFVSCAPTGPGLTTRTAYINGRTGVPASTVTRLQPVVGSVQRVGHSTNPFTHKAKYASTSYNPVLGTFGTYTFRQ